MTKSEMNIEVTKMVDTMDIKCKEYAVETLTKIIETVANNLSNKTTTNVDEELKQQLLKNMLCSAQVISEYQDNSSFRKCLSDNIFFSTYKK
jgi:hypothetical protein